MNKEDLEILEEISDIVKEMFSIDFNLEGVQRLEEEISDKRDEFQTWKESKQDEWVEDFGAFIGRCLIENYNGKWVNHNGQTGIKIEGSDIFANPFTKVWKQFQIGGEFDSISSFYEITPNLNAIINNKKE